jgi:hypothetical protein
MDGHSEQDLIQKAKAGDNVAYEDVLRPNLQPAARLARVLLGDPDEAEDAVQEAAVRGWRRLGNLRAGAEFRPWFLGIVVRQVRTIQRGHWWTLSAYRTCPFSRLRLMKGGWMARICVALSGSCHDHNAKQCSCISTSICASRT